ncbi:hypothetical protein Pmani_008508 [Petrolisthes manimaculis]|uniref:Glutaminyl-peptide cyclotransferase n=1 Tax=Petrolisthes manimaculis TaxID=1843537 RepID=A0AAE1UIW9_9EUCA|nr:hypothetical protein Pmani_008508 [Petrolisthes manimaculis]
MMEEIRVKIETLQDEERELISRGKKIKREVFEGSDDKDEGLEAVRNIFGGDIDYGEFGHYENCEGCADEENIDDSENEQFSKSFMENRKYLSKENDKREELEVEEGNDEVEEASDEDENGWWKENISGCLGGVRTCAAMLLKTNACVALLYTFAALHCTNGHDNNNKRSRILWYNAKNTHTGLGLSNGTLQELSRLASDLTQFQALLAPLMVTRVVGTQGHSNVRKHLVDTMEGLNWDVEQLSFDARTPVGHKTFTNVVATLDPSATRRLVIACHYDSKIDTRGDFIGATDSAVPCAMMLHLAAALHSQLSTHSLKQSDLTLQFIFFDGEEAFHRWSNTDSLYGSRNLAARLHNQPYPPNNQDNTHELHRMDLFVLLDLLGTRDVSFYSFFPNTQQWYARMLSFERRLGELQLLNSRPNMFIDKALHKTGIQDDHIPFLKRDVPILHLIPVPFPSVWHELTDNEQALHYPTIDNLNRILFAFTADYLNIVP